MKGYRFRSANGRGMGGGVPGEQAGALGSPTPHGGVGAALHSPEAVQSPPCVTTSMGCCPPGSPPALWCPGPWALVTWTWLTPPPPHAALSLILPEVELTPCGPGSPINPTMSRGPRPKINKDTLMKQGAPRAQRCPPRSLAKARPSVCREWAPQVC